MHVIFGMDYKISVAHVSYFHAHFPPTRIRLISVISKLSDSLKPTSPWDAGSSCHVRTDVSARRGIIEALAYILYMRERYYFSSNVYINRGY